MPSNKPSDPMGNNLDSIIEQFDFVWGIAPEGTPKHDRGEHIREIIREAHQQGFKEAVKKIKKSVNTNQKGTFTDDGGNDCWYLDKLNTLLDE